MAFVLLASVGRMGGVNHTEDVRKVQNALNKVPKSEGGPPKPLDPDGKCGTKTIEAIQLFQIKHFGWGGADGRVDVNGPTHRKLNEYDGGITPVVETIPTSESFSLRFDHRVKEKNVEWRLMITDEANEITRLYRVQQDMSWPKDKFARKWTKPYPLSMPKPIPVTGFHDAKFGYRSTLHYDPRKPDFERRTWINVMALQLVGEDRQTNHVHTPTNIWDCWYEMQKNPDKPGTYTGQVTGFLKLIEDVNVEVPPLAFSAPIAPGGDLEEIEIMKRLGRA
jgi:hypothetical protein